MKSPGNYCGRRHNIEKAMAEQLAADGDIQTLVASTRPQTHYFRDTHWTYTLAFLKSKLSKVAKVPKKLKGCNIKIVPPISNPCFRNSIFPDDPSGLLQN